ncbi:apolipoprotein N-acyltransferase [Vulgatibacter incomptus]|uniref:apolipoprotein N-acyltransferase n=1 Tax=Vulgatibacter incomptus TaxID=1391653 RepID=UPI0014707132|nr:apolipoprotein N-acyltransferase [Vulgatibacter incomptus]
MRLSRTLRPAALLVASGLLYSIGFVDFDRWYFAWISLVPLLFALRDVGTWKRALAFSWIMGFVAHLVGYHWVIHLLREFAHLPVPLAVLGWLLLAVGQSASFAAWGLLAWFLRRRAGLPLGAALPIAIMAVEFAFPLLFPSYMANSQARMPWVTQIADLGGVVLVSGLLALVNGAIYELVEARRRRACEEFTSSREAEGGADEKKSVSARSAAEEIGPASAGPISSLARHPLPWKLAAGALGSLALTVGYSAVRIGQVEARDEAAPKLKTAIVQANVGAGSKHADVDGGIRRFQRMTDEAMDLPGIGLVVWPESGFNRAVTPRLPNLTGLVAAEVKAPMILGALRADVSSGKRKIWNSALALDTGGEIVAHYDKTVLLAFGEYVPGDSLFPGIYDLLPYTSHFERGASVEPLPVGPYRLSTDICYEDILPGFIRSLMGPVDAEGRRPHAMVNVTNDSWYGPVEPHIHLALATFRSIEHRRWLVRSTATGISAFVDSAGRIRKQSGFETEEVLVEDVPMIDGGATVYGVLGDWPGWLALVASGAALAWPGALSRARRRDPEAEDLPDGRAA